MLYCRLAAIRSFINFVATKDPTSIAQCVEILNIPIKRAPVSEPCYRDPPEVAAILAQPDRSSLEGMRDHALFSFLYNSGARIQEALDVCPAAVRSIAQVASVLPARAARNVSARLGQKR
nr:hypothetical protein [Ensifer sp. IC4062]